MTPSRPQVARVLQIIPTHRQQAKSVETLRIELRGDEAASAIEMTLAWLHAFGALQARIHGADGVRAKDQRASYFIQSLCLWLEHAGDDDSLITSDLIRAMELRRVQVAGRMGNLAQPTRLQAAALVLIACERAGEVHVLCQWDQRAEQYQIIGGRVEPGETAAQAAEREFFEEVGASQTPPLRVGAEVELRALLGEPIVMDDISPTYGALTRYTFHIFQAQIARTTLLLGPDDAWIAVSDLLHGHTGEGKHMGNPRIYYELDARVAGGFAGLLGSVASHD